VRVTPVLKSETKSSFSSPWMCTGVRRIWRPAVQTRGLENDDLVTRRAGGRIPGTPCGWGCARKAGDCVRGTLNTPRQSIGSGESVQRTFQGNWYKCFILGSFEPTVDTSKVHHLSKEPSRVNQSAHIFELPVLVELTNTDPFAAWFVVIGDATADEIRVVRSVLGAISSFPSSLWPLRTAILKHSGVARTPCEWWSV
jgi:hypothetical protein